MRNVERVAIGIVVTGALAGTALAAASKAPAKAPTRDVTGSYMASGASANDTFTLDVVQGDGAIAAEFLGAWGISTHNCDCMLEGKPGADGKWVLGGEAKGTLAVFGDKLVLELDQPPSCCGAEFPGAPDFKLADAQKPVACTVKAAKAPFMTPASVATKRFVVKGDKIEGFATGGEEEKDLVLSRYMGKKKTVGFLRFGDLACAVPAKPAATPAPSATPDTEPE